MKKSKSKYILGIETSCDETGLAVIEKSPGKKPKIIESFLYSQEATHAQTGGIVPEIASREQARKIFSLLNKIAEKFPLDRIDLISVTKGPGLVGSLLVGINLAKTLSYCLGKPILGINHLKAHLYSAFLYKDELDFPLVGMIVSGGHTSILKADNHQHMKVLGQTLDDAAGEAFDKTAQLLGLTYPGGPAISQAALKAKNKKTEKFNLPRPLINQKNLDFSFSGLKTAVLNANQKNKMTADNINQLAYEFQEAITDVIVEKIYRASLEHKAKNIILGGGVVANQRLREKIKEKNFPIPVYIPPIKLCTDNGAMIASRASYLFELDQKDNWAKLKVQPTFKI